MIGMITAGIVMTKEFTKKSLNVAPPWLVLRTVV